MVYINICSMGINKSNPVLGTEVLAFVMLLLWGLHQDPENMLNSVLG